MIGLAMMLATGDPTNFMDGNALYAKCTGAAVGQAVCSAYIVGVLEGATAMQSGEKSSYICVPDNVTGRQVKEVVVNYLTAHPGDRALPAGALSVVALMKAFPCPKA